MCCQDEQEITAYHLAKVERGAGVGWASSTLLEEGPHAVCSGLPGGEATVPAGLILRWHSL